MRFFVDMHYQVDRSVAVNDDRCTALLTAFQEHVPMGVADLSVCGLPATGRVTVSATIRAPEPPAALDVLQPVIDMVFTAVLGGTEAVTVVGFDVEAEPTAALTPDAVRTLDALIEHLDEPGPFVIETALARYAATAMAALAVPFAAAPTSIVDDLGAC
ncbi:hypothetical protein [Stackebrandtia soli]|uniref:hypothetical protein n=1 Tax=Stackebrandtia soli TaxID=1892856 RepID=UPI0039E99D7C